MLLRLIATTCPKVETLSMVTDLIQVECLLGFRNLVSFSWSGYSLSTPQETLFTLNTLPSLHTLRLERWPETYEPQYMSMDPQENLSFTSEVLQNLRPLKHFAIDHADIEFESDILTAAMLRACSSHRGSLAGLELLSDQFVESAVMEEILNVLSPLNLTWVCIRLRAVPEDYEGLKPEPYISKSVRHCSIALRTHGRYFNRDIRHEFGWAEER